MFGDDFYPTPEDLIDTMLSKVANFEGISSILEPSAGRGDIIEKIESKTRYGRKVEIDAIEADPELALILEGKGHSPVSRDFLTFKTYRPYDLIIMNPPFSDGDKHLLKAIEVQKSGGQIVCLLNAETIRNPYTPRRQTLVSLIEPLSGTIEYIQSAFATADRKTDVEVALIYLNIEYKPQSDILRNLIEAKAVDYDDNGNLGDIVEGDYINGAVRRYEVEAEAGLKFLAEYQALKPLLTTEFVKEGGDSFRRRPIIEIKVDGRDYDEPRTSFIERLRMKYWSELFQSDIFSRLFTEKTRESYRNRIADLKRYEFNKTNIKQMQMDISSTILATLDDSIVALFDEFSNQYWDEQSNNIHYYNGWKTNKAYLVNKRIITRLYSFDTWNGKLDEYKAFGKMSDIEKVFAYLDGRPDPDQTQQREAIREAAQTGNNRNVELTYCTVSFYKKGTAHITFKREDLLKKFNFIGSQRKGWLPPNYGKASYEAMTDEERAVVDDFEGKESYAETRANLAFYESRPMLSIGAGELQEA